MSIILPFGYALHCFVVGLAFPNAAAQATPHDTVLFSGQCRNPGGVHALALLLMELQPGSEAPQILMADALYQLGRVEEAYRLLLSIEHTTTRSPILARLALLQLHRGFLYDANQVLGLLFEKFICV